MHDHCAHCDVATDYAEPNGHSAPCHWGCNE